ncbi:MAG: hypothetical protein ACLFUJ_01235 [Phycisphaerae bacterium]
MIGFVSPAMFGAAIYLLIGLLVLGLLALVAAVLGWAAWRGHCLTVRQSRAEAQAALNRLDRRGQLKPPTGRGLCDVCQHLSDSVLFLPTGQRLCPTCYDERIDSESREEPPCPKN